jgi:zeta-carotene desaturase
VVAAVPQDVLLELLSESVAASEPFAGLRNLASSPITGIHLWYDRRVMHEPFRTLLDRTTQWIFNKSLLGGSTTQNGEGSQHLQLVISASYDLVQKSRAEILELCCGELREVLPATREAQLLKSTMIKEVHATFSPAPGCDRWRPAQRSPVPGLFLAGDWTATGWPATMEGAVRSGYLAAEELLRAEGRRVALLQPDLPTEGLGRLCAAG